MAPQLPLTEAQKERIAINREAAIARCLAWCSAGLPDRATWHSHRQHLNPQQPRYPEADRITQTNQVSNPFFIRTRPEPDNNRNLRPSFLSKLDAVPSRVETVGRPSLSPGIAPGVEMEDRGDCGDALPKPAEALDCNLRLEADLAKGIPSSNLNGPNGTVPDVALTAVHTGVDSDSRKGVGGDGALGLQWPPKQKFDFFLVIDFESTCDNRKALRPQEIIEFPCVIVNARTLELEASWRTYVKPDVHPRLTPFCTKLTGITQDRVEGGVPLQVALSQHDTWLQERGVAACDFAVVTWSDWDCKVMLESECKWRQIQKPLYFNRWINLKVAYEASRLRKPETGGGLRVAVESAGIRWSGRAHSGLDDATNTAKLLVSLIKRGAILDITGRFTKYDSNGAQTPGVDVLNSQPKPTEANPNGVGAVEMKSGGVEGQRGGAEGGVIRVRKGRGKRRWVGVSAEEERDRPTGAAVCNCGAKSKRRIVNKPGLTNGKAFYSCGKWTITAGGSCNFFVWATQPCEKGDCEQ